MSREDILKELEELMVVTGDIRGRDGEYLSDHITSLIRRIKEDQSQA